MKWLACVLPIVVVSLPLAGTTNAESIGVTLHPADPQSVTFSDADGEYFTDWRIWMSVGDDDGDGDLDDGWPAIADEKLGATNIDVVTVSQGTRAGGHSSPHAFSYADADTEDGSGATDFTRAIKLCGGQNSPVSLSFSTSGLGSAGTLYVYSGGWASANKLDATIGSVSVSAPRSYDGSDYCDWWEIEYSGVTDPLATLDITLTTTSHYHDLQLYAAALKTAPEPSTMAGLVGLALTGSLGYFWRRRKA